MFFKLVSTITLKKSSAGTNEPTGQQPKLAGPATIAPKKPSVLGRVLKAIKSPICKPRCFCTPREGFDPYNPYPTLRLAEYPVAAAPLPNSTPTAANSPLLPPPRSAISTPTTVDSGYLSAPTPDRSPRPSDNHRRDPQDGARQLAIDRLVEALEVDPQNTQALRQSEADRIWDAEEARALAKEEEEENAKRRGQQSDLQVKSDFTSSSRDRLILSGFVAQARRRRDSSNGPHRVYRRANLSDTSGDCVPVNVRGVSVATRSGREVEHHSTRERDPTRSSPVEEYRDEDDWNLRPLVKGPCHLPF
ncbi:hypothetical protein FRC04_001260 [Tulasnella sp. 424]|nr:hypothetical protein FRC04_001260 [Tulasnella sp. 424]